MALLDLPATKSSLLALKRQLAFAEEGYSLLDQKRELLLGELTVTSGRARQARLKAEDALRRAFSALREATLDAGSSAVDRAALGARAAHKAEIGERRLMGVRLPEAYGMAEPAFTAFGPGGTPAAADLAGKLFAGALPLLAGLAGLETAVLRLARELKKTQRRCNALSKRLMPDCRETISFLSGNLEERERESLIVLKMARDRLRSSRE